LIFTVSGGMLEMRLYIRACALLSVGVLLGNLQLQSLGQRKKPTTATQRATPKRSLDEEGRQEAEKYWHGVLTLCGDSYYIKSFADPQPAKRFGVPNEIKGYRIFQLKGISITSEGQAVQPTRLSEADLLNGVKQSRSGEGLQWVGKSTLWARVGRTGRHEEVDTPEERLSWNKWSDQGNYLLVNVEKRDGKWSFSSTIGAGYTRFFAPITCGLIKESSQIESVSYFDREGYLRFLAVQTGWFSLGRGPLTIMTAPDTAGFIAVERDERLSTPVWGEQGTRARGDFLAPGLPIGALIFKVGVSGQSNVIFDLYHLNRRIDTTEEVFIGINDSDYSDNKGEFKLRIRRNGSDYGRYSDNPPSTNTLPLGRVGEPSSRYQLYSELDLLQIKVPDNWSERRENDSVWFAPEGAYGQVGGQHVFTHGINFKVMNSIAQSLNAANDQMISNLLQSHPKMLRIGRSQGSNRATRYWMRTEFTNVNEATGKTETVALFATQLSNGNVLFISTVVPQNESGEFQAAFDRVLNSVQIND
jgi:hypothetical protein